MPNIISVEAAKVLLYYGEHKLEDMIFFIFFFAIYTIFKAMVLATNKHIPQNYLGTASEPIQHFLFRQQVLSKLIFNQKMRKIWNLKKKRKKA